MPLLFLWLGRRYVLDVDLESCTKLTLSAIGVFQDYYSRHQLKKYSPSEISWIPSTELFMLFVGVSLPITYTGQKADKRSRVP